jgi:hypothetical protein
MIISISFHIIAYPVNLGDVPFFYNNDEKIVPSNLILTREPYISPNERRKIVDGQGKPMPPLITIQALSTTVAPNSILGILIAVMDLRHTSCKARWRQTLLL